SGKLCVGVMAAQRGHSWGTRPGEGVGGGGRGAGQCGGVGDGEGELAMEQRGGRGAWLRQEGQGLGCPPGHYRDLRVGVGKWCSWGMGTGMGVEGNLDVRLQGGRVGLSVKRESLPALPALLCVSPAFAAAPAAPTGRAMALPAASAAASPSAFEATAVPSPTLAPAVPSLATAGAALSLAPVPVTPFPAAPVAPPPIPAPTVASVAPAAVLAASTAAVSDTAAGSVAPTPAKPVSMASALCLARVTVPAAPSPTTPIAPSRAAFAAPSSAASAAPSHTNSLTPSRAVSAASPPLALPSPASMCLGMRGVARLRDLPDRRGAPGSAFPPLAGCWGIVTEAACLAVAV
ncbi:unnamed protein product, partial [Closterium sp. NIES-65]